MNNPPDILLNVCVLSPDMGTLAAVWSIFVITPATFSLFSRSPEDWRDNNNIIESSQGIFMRIIPFLDVRLGRRQLGDLQISLPGSVSNGISCDRLQTLY